MSLSAKALSMRSSSTQPRCRKGRIHSNYMHVIAIMAFRYYFADQLRKADSFTKRPPNQLPLSTCLLR